MPLSAQPSLAQDARVAGRSFELTFVERQSHTLDLIPSASSVPGVALNSGNSQRAVSQDNRVALTFRAGQQVDYERERNYGSIYQRDPKPDNKSRVHSLKGGSGTIGAWFDIPHSDFNNVKMRVNTQDNHILAEIHGPNFMQRFQITTDGTSCAAEISYQLDPGQTAFRMMNLRTKQTRELTALSAEDVRCRIGTANIF